MICVRGSTCCHGHCASVHARELQCRPAGARARARAPTAAARVPAAARAVLRYEIQVSQGWTWTPTSSVQLQVKQWCDGDMHWHENCPGSSKSPHTGKLQVETARPDNCEGMCLYLHVSVGIVSGSACICWYHVSICMYV